MTRYSNLWSDGENIVKSESRPTEYHYPLWADSRVRGSNYTPYEVWHGSTEWVRAANRSMASHARSNFERRR